MRFCVDFLGKPVITEDERKVGKIYDAQINQRHIFPKINALILRPRRGRSRSASIRKIIQAVKSKESKILIRIPWSAVKEIEKKRIVLKMDEERWKIFYEEASKANLPKGISLVKDILDEQIVDADHHFLDRVDDIKIERIGKHLRVIGLEIGLEGALERLGFDKILSKLGIRISEKIVPWYLISKISIKRRKILLKIPGEIL